MKLFIVQVRDSTHNWRPARNLDMQVLSFDKMKYARECLNNCVNVHPLAFDILRKFQTRYRITTVNLDEDASYRTGTMVRKKGDNR